MKLQNIKSGDIATFLFRSMLIFGMTYVFLFPLLYMLSVSIRAPGSINDPSIVWIPKALSLENLKESMKILNYSQSALLTFTISVLSMTGTLISCSLVGYGLARFKFTEKKIVFGLVILTIIVPPQLILISSFLNFRYFNFGGILNIFKAFTGFGFIDLTEMPLTPLTFILPSLLGVGIRGGLFIFIFRQFFSGMPKDLEEAARMDGCGYLKTYMRIILPLAGPAIITVMLFSFIWHWNDYFTSAMYFVGDLKPISVMLSNIDSLLRTSGNYGTFKSPYQISIYLASGSLLTILPPLILYIFTQKYFTQSIERTGIVG